jgi:hypothetical protein
MRQPAVSQLFKGARRELGSSIARTVPPIVADRDRLMQVMLNLLSNAAQFAERRTARVSVSLTRQDDFLRWTSPTTASASARPTRRSSSTSLRQVGDYPLTRKADGLRPWASRFPARTVKHFGGRCVVKKPTGPRIDVQFTRP